MMYFRQSVLNGVLNGADAKLCGRQKGIAITCSCKVWQ